jgi:hypothetical protein
MRASLWFVAAGLAVAFAAPAAQAQPGGSYLASCQNVQTSRGHDPQISASCKDMSGNWRFTTLRYRGCVGDIGNANGQLVCQGGRPGDDTSPSWGQPQASGSFQASCRNVRDSGGRDPQLTASCKDMSGRWQYTSLRYRSCVGDIGNNNGQLFCDRGGPGGGGGPGWGGGRPPGR